MSKFTTGEIAKLAGVSVRTVQYYDSRNILAPSELSEGGRRLYSEEDLKKMKTICFLREVGLPINSIGDLIREENPETIISTLLDQQEQVLREELNERQTKLDTISNMRRELKGLQNISVESIGDIAHIVKNKKELNKLRATILITGIPISIFQIVAIMHLLFTGKWILLLIWVGILMPYAIWVSLFYFKQVAYVCPECHEIFKANLKDAILADHTPTLRKLTCSHCGHHGFCVETYRKEEKQ